MSSWSFSIVCVICQNLPVLFQFSYVNKLQYTTRVGIEIFHLLQERDIFYIPLKLGRNSVKFVDF